MVNENRGICYVLYLDDESYKAIHVPAVQRLITTATNAWRSR